MKLFKITFDSTKFMYSDMDNFPTTLLVIAENFNEALEKICDNKKVTIYILCYAIVSVTSEEYLQEEIIS